MNSLSGHRRGYSQENVASGFTAGLGRVERFSQKVSPRKNRIRVKTFR